MLESWFVKHLRNYIPVRRRYAKYRTYVNRVRYFLRFCERKKGLTGIAQLRKDSQSLQDCYAEFIRYLRSKHYRESTIRDWKYAIQLFAKSFNIPLRVRLRRKDYAH